MSGIGLLHRIHGETLDGVDRHLLTITHVASVLAGEAELPGRSFSLTFVEGWFFLIAGLLIPSGARKLADPAPTIGALSAARLPVHRMSVYLLGVIEIISGGAGLLSSSAWATGAVLALYLGFTAFVGMALVRRIPLASCGCFGKADTPPTLVHLMFDIAAVTGTIWALALGRGSLTSVVALQPLGGFAYVGFVLIGIYCLYLLLADVPLLVKRT